MRNDTTDAGFSYLIKLNVWKVQCVGSSMCGKFNVCLLRLRQLRARGGIKTLACEVVVVPGENSRLCKALTGCGGMYSLDFENRQKLNLFVNHRGLFNKVYL